MLFSGLAAATTLTKLEMEGWPVQTQQGAMQAGVAACSSLARLQQLQHLCIQHVSLVPGDALALTALSNITHLALHRCCCGVDEGVIKALACSLTNLQDLRLQAHANITSAACLASVGHLTQLTNLFLAGCRDAGAEAVALLKVQLHKLQRCDIIRMGS